MAQFAQAEEMPIGPEQRAPVGGEGTGHLPAAELQGFFPFRHGAPHLLSRLQFDAHQSRIGLIAAVESIQIPVPVNGRVPVQAEVGRGPGHPPGSVGPKVEQRRSRFVAGRDQHLVADHHRIGSIDRLIAAASPGKAEVDLSVSGIDAQQPAGGRAAFAAGEDKNAPLASHRGRNRRRIAGTPLVSGLPNEFAGLFIQSDHRRPSRGTHIDNQQVSLDQGSRSDPEEILGHPELSRQVAFPVNCTGLQVEAMELAFGAVCVDAVAVDHRAAAGPVVVTVAVAVASRVAKGPVALSGFGMQAVDDLLLVLAVEVNQPGVVDGG